MCEKPIPDTICGEHKRDVIFDAKLFNQTRQLIQQHHTPTRPMLSYILTLYGHMPYGIDYDRQPKKVTLHEPAGDATLERIANQTYYRTRALMDYVDTIVKSDPNALIVVAGDHLPGLTRSSSEYKDLGYTPKLTDNWDAGLRESRALILDRGKPIRVEPQAMFSLRDVILDRLSEGALCAEKVCLKGNPHKARTVVEADIQTYQSLLAPAIGDME